jgi:AcrR family transcriptional regulator
MNSITQRRRNPRGEGSRLRQDILDAARQILEATGSAEAVTLRAIARGVGISAPSIYTHFPDREAVLDELIVDGFNEMTAALEGAAAPLGDARERLYANCRAFLRFADECPRRYMMLFDHRADPERCTLESEPLVHGLAAFDVMVRGIAECAKAGLSASQDHFVDAAALWVALHGLATLPCGTPGFPWPDLDRLLVALVDRVAQLAPE